jgi:hypothetical protein
VASPLYATIVDGDPVDALEPLPHIELFRCARLAVCGRSSVFTMADDPGGRSIEFLSRAGRHAPGHPLVDHDNKRSRLVCPPRLPRENLAPFTPTHEPRIRSISAIRVMIQPESGIVHFIVVRVEVAPPGSRIYPIDYSIVGPHASTGRCGSSPEHGENCLFEGNCRFQHHTCVKERGNMNIAG